MAETNDVIPEEFITNVKRSIDGPARDVGDLHAQAWGLHAEAMRRCALQRRVVAQARERMKTRASEIRRDRDEHAAGRVDDDIQLDQGHAVLRERLDDEELALDELVTQQRILEHAMTVLSRQITVRQIGTKLEQDALQVPHRGRGKAARHA